VMNIICSSCEMYSFCHCEESSTKQSRVQDYMGTWIATPAARNDGDGSLGEPQ
jgi:hypothetical protein